MKSSRSTIASVVTGLLIGLVIAIGAGLWLQARALDAQAESISARSAIANLRAMTEMVERLGLDDERLQPAVTRFAEDQPGLEVVRVVKFKGIRLVASNAPGDAGDNAAPRKMARDEKPLYDLGQSLRANVETNVKEGRLWKPEIDVSPGDGRTLRLAGPVEIEGKIVGAVLTENGGGIEASGPPWLYAAAALVGPVLIFLLVAPLLRGRLMPLLLVAAALLLAGVWLYGRGGLSRLETERLAGESALAEQLQGKLDAARSVFSASALDETPALDVTDWDTDSFRQPLGRQSSDGPVEEMVAEDHRAERGSYWKLSATPTIIGVLVVGFFGFGAAARTGQTLVKHRRAYGYVLPAMAGMTLLVFLPFFYGILLSFTNSNIYNTNQPLNEIWTGFQNFTEILTDFELVKTTPEGRVFDYQNFYWTLGFTIIWTISNVAIGVSIGLLLALLLNTRGLVLKPIYRVLLILPWAMPNYITALIWRGMFHSQFGVINQGIQMLGGDAISWFDTPFRSFITVLSTNGWLSFPFMMVISLGALQSIPADLYEAARVDGASRWAQFKAITLPSLKPALIPAIIISVIWTFNQFNVIFLVAGGEPGGSTEILITEAYKIAFEQYRYGYAAAYSVVIFLVLFTYGLWQIRVTKATEGI